MYRFDTSVHHFPGNDPVGQILDTYNTAANGIINRAAAMQSIRQKEAMFPQLQKQLELSNATREFENDFNSATSDMSIEAIRLKNEELGIEVADKKQNLNFSTELLKQSSAFASGYNPMNAFLPKATPAPQPAMKAIPVAEEDVIDQTSTQGVFDIKLSSYTPGKGDLKMEGGPLDRHGRQAYTYEQFHAGEAPYVAVAMDTKSELQGKTLTSDKFPNTIFKVVDTGGAFKGKGNSRMDIAFSDPARQFSFPVKSAVFKVSGGSYGFGSEM